MLSCFHILNPKINLSIMKRCANNEEENFIRKKAKVCAEPMQEMIRPSDVPGYLHDSEFYKSLNLEDDEEFHMSSNLMKKSKEVECLQDLADLLNTIRYWGVDVFPNSIVKFVVTQTFATLKPILDAVANELTQVKMLLIAVDPKMNVEKRMEAAMEMGEIDVVRHVAKVRNEFIFTKRAIALAADNTSVNCLQYALKHSDRWTGELTPNRIHYHGHVRYIQIYCDDVFAGAVAHGHLSSVELLYQHGFRLSFPSGNNTLAQGAAVNDQLECLQYLHEHGCTLYYCAAAAASGGSIACLQYVVQRKRLHDGNWNYTVCEAAARGGHLQCLKYLHEQGCPWTDEVCVIAANANSTACLQYAHTNGRSMSPDVCVSAATVGSLDCLKYYCEHGGEWSFLACHAAALHGHLACLEYAHTHGCPLVDETNCFSTIAYWRRFQVPDGPAHLVEEVAKRKHWGCVLYLILHNYPLTSALTVQLVRKHKDNLLQLAVERGCPLAVEVSVRYSRCGNLEGLVYALEHGSKPSVQVLTAAARKGHLQCLTYAHQHGCPWNKNVCVAAARGGHLECLQYAREHGCPWDATRVRRAAADMHHECIVQYCDEHADSGGEELVIRCSARIGKTSCVC